MKLTKLLATTALGLTLAGGAHAAAINGSFGAAGLSPTPDTNPIAIGTTFSFTGGVTTSVGTGDLSGLPGGTLFTISTFTASTSGVFSYIIPNWGSFTSVGNLVVSQTGPATNRTVGVFAVGTFTPNPTNLPGFDPGAASVTFSATQTGATQISYSASFTFASPPAPPPDVPEPMSVALFGLGLAGLGVAMRRKA